MTERRRSTRHRMVRSATIYAGASSISCAALDVSATGAHFYLPDATLQSDVVLLHVVLQLPDGSRQPARRCWQAGQDIGFEFQPAA